MFQKSKEKSYIWRVFNRLFCKWYCSKSSVSRWQYCIQILPGCLDSSWFSTGSGGHVVSEFVAIYQPTSFCGRASVISAESLSPRISKCKPRKATICCHRRVTDSLKSKVRGRLVLGRGSPRLLGCIMVLQIISQTRGGVLGNIPQEKRGEPSEAPPGKEGGAPSPEKPDS